MKKEKIIWKIATLLSVIGIALASYLLYNFLAPVPSEFCTISATVNCNAVTKGDLALFLGIPVAVVGFIGYISILIGSIKRWKKFVLFMSGFGTLFCLRLTYLEIFKEHVLCPVCMACQVVMLTLFALFLYVNFKKE